MEVFVLGSICINIYNAIMYFFYLSSCLAWLAGNFVRLTWSCPGCSKLGHNWADNSQLRQLQSNIFNTRSLGGRKIWFLDVELNLIWHKRISCHCLELIQVGPGVQIWNMAFFRKWWGDRGQGEVVREGFKWSKWKFKMIFPIRRLTPPLIVIVSKHFFVPLF